jgi:hypothetical protein
MIHFLDAGGALTDSQISPFDAATSPVPLPGSPATNAPSRISAKRDGSYLFYLIEKSAVRLKIRAAVTDNC